MEYSGLMDEGSILGYIPRIPNNADPAIVRAEPTHAFIHFCSAIEFLDKQLGKDFVLVCLQPTSPLRTSEDIDKALEEFLKNPKAEAIVSVCECEHHPLWSGVLPEDRNMKNFLKPDIINKNSQELPKYYRLNGAIYIGRASYLRKNKSFFGEKTYAYVMPSFRSVDIDTILDFKFAEFLLREVLENKEVK